MSGAVRRLVGQLAPHRLAGVLPPALQCVARIRAAQGHAVRSDFHAGLASSCSSKSLASQPPPRAADCSRFGPAGSSLCPPRYTRRPLAGEGVFLAEASIAAAIFSCCEAKPSLRPAPPAALARTGATAGQRRRGAPIHARAPHAPAPACRRCVLEPNGQTQAPRRAVASAPGHPNVTSCARLCRRARKGMLVAQHSAAAQSHGHQPPLGPWRACRGSGPSAAAASSRPFPPACTALFSVS